MSLWVALKTKDFGWKSRSWETGFPKAKKKKRLFKEEVTKCIRYLWEVDKKIALSYLLIFSYTVAIGNFRKKFLRER